MPPRIVTLALLALAAAALSGCGTSEPSASAPTRGPPPRGGSSAPRIAPAPPATPRGEAPSFPERSSGAPTGSAAASGGSLAETETSTEDRPGQPTARDLGAELRAALGVPSDCLPPEVTRTLGAELRLPVRAWVTTTGRVTRAEVGGSAPASVRDCVQRRAEALTMVGPVEGAPRGVSTELVVAIRRQEPSSPATPEPPAWRPPPGAQPPGIALPATGAPGPAPGAVAPGSTLPAVGAEGRPAGFVPPSSTLPAIAE